MNSRAVVTFPVFSGYKIRIIFARDVCATGKRLGVDLTGAVAAHVNGGGPCAWIVFGLIPDAATIAHEASHAVRCLLTWAGARNDNETFAYHLDFLVGRIHRYLKRRSKR